MCAGLLLAPCALVAPAHARPQAAGAPAQQKGGAAKAQPAPAQSAPAAEQSAPKPALSVKMSRDAPHTFTVKAKGAKLSEVAAELSKLLKTPIQLSPLLSRQPANLDFGGLNLEATVRMLAPQAYVDYVAGGDLAEAKPLAIYMQAYNERPPALTATVKGSSEAILIEGDTEEGVETEEERRKKEEAEPLKVSYSNNQLSVRAKRQPLTVVLYRVASELGVPFELKYETPELIDIDFSNFSVEQAVRSLSPHVRFYYRLDLQTFQLQPIRLALVPPATAKS